MSDPTRNLCFLQSGAVLTNPLASFTYQWNSASFLGLTSVTTGALMLGYTSKTSTYAIAAGDHTINCTTGTFTVTLPTASGRAGQVYVIKNSGSGVITVATTSAQTIDTDSTVSLIEFESIQVQSTGSNWIIASRVGGPVSLDNVTGISNAGKNILVLSPAGDSMIKLDAGSSATLLDANATGSFIAGTTVSSGSVSPANNLSWSNGMVTGAS